MITLNTHELDLYTRLKALRTVTVTHNIDHAQALINQGLATQKLLVFRPGHVALTITLKNGQKGVKLVINQ